MNNKKVNKVFIVIFLSLLIVPNIIMLTELDKRFLLKENRQIRRFSDISFKTPRSLMSSFKWAYRDNFGLKNSSFLFYSYVKNNLLGESALPTKTIQGKSGWYFLGNSEGNVLNNSVGVSKLTNNEWRIANSNIDRLFKKIKKTKVPFYMVISRHKHEVYPEYLPFSIQRGVSKFDTLYNHWIDKYKPNVIDLKSSVLQNKSKGQLYHKTDTHWNEFGAFFGFNLIVDKLQGEFPSIKQVALSDYLIKKDTVYQQDLTAMINKLEKESVVKLEKINNEHGELLPYKYKGYNTRKFVNNTKELKVIVFRDSFSLAMMQYFKETFGETIFLKTRVPDLKFIEDEKPDLVILQITSRRFEEICNKIVY